MPLRRGVSRVKSFWYGQLSAIVEPWQGCGRGCRDLHANILPFALSFAAGAMIFVVVEEVIPETQRDKYTDLAVLGFMLGFTIMMIWTLRLASRDGFENGLEKYFPKTFNSPFGGFR